MNDLILKLLEDNLAIGKKIIINDNLSMIPLYKLYLNNDNLDVTKGIKKINHEWSKIEVVGILKVLGNDISIVNINKANNNLELDKALGNIMKLIV